MKLIEAMKKIKENDEKIKDLLNKIKLNCANYQHETSPYGERTDMIVSGWIQAVEDLTRDNLELHRRIQSTNLATNVQIELNGIIIVRSIAEWVLRRRIYAAMDLAAWQALTDRNLKEGIMKDSTGREIEVKIRRYFNPQIRDNKVDTYRSEPHRIDAALEVVNATTDLLP